MLIPDTDKIINTLKIYREAIGRFGRAACFEQAKPSRGCRAAKGLRPSAVR